MVSAKFAPRYVLTSGLAKTIGAEFIVAGASHFADADILEVIDAVRERRSHDSLASQLTVEPFGTWRCRAVSSTWLQLLTGSIADEAFRPRAALQLFPEAGNWTMDIPDLGVPYGQTAVGAWRWLPKGEAPHAIPEGASAATELAVLRGEEVTHVRRWSAHDWGVWSDPTLLRNWEDVRTVPLISLLASDPTLMCALSLRVGEGLQRLSQSHDWVVNASEINRTSYRVMLRTDEFTTFEGYSESLRALGCNCQSVASRVLALTVPPEADKTEIRAILQIGEHAGVLRFQQTA